MKIKIPTFNFFVCFAVAANLYGVNALQHSIKQVVQDGLQKLSSGRDFLSPEYHREKHILSTFDIRLVRRKEPTTLRERTDRLSNYATSDGRRNLEHRDFRNRKEGARKEARTHTFDLRREFASEKENMHSSRAEQRRLARGILENLPRSGENIKQELGPRYSTILRTNDIEIDSRRKNNEVLDYRSFTTDNRNERQQRKEVRENERRSNYNYNDNVLDLSKIPEVERRLERVETQRKQISRRLIPRVAANENNVRSGSENSRIKVRDLQNDGQQLRVYSIREDRRIREERAMENRRRNVNEFYRLSNRSLRRAVDSDLANARTRNQIARMGRLHEKQFPLAISSRDLETQQRDRYIGMDNENEQRQRNYIHKARGLKYVDRYTSNAEFRRVSRENLDGQRRRTEMNHNINERNDQRHSIKRLSQPDRFQYVPVGSERQETRRVQRRAPLTSRLRLDDRHYLKARELSKSLRRETLRLGEQHNRRERSLMLERQSRERENVFSGERRLSFRRYVSKSEETYSRDRVGSSLDGEVSRAVRHVSERRVSDHLQQQNRLDLLSSSRNIQRSINTVMANVNERGDRQPYSRRVAERRLGNRERRQEGDSITTDVRHRQDDRLIRKASLLREKRENILEQRNELVLERRRSRDTNFRLRYLEIGQLRTVTADGLNSNGRRESHALRNQRRIERSVSVERGQRFLESRYREEEFSRVRADTAVRNNEQKIMVKQNQDRKEMSRVGNAYVHRERSTRSEMRREDVLRTLSERSFEAPNAKKSSVKYDAMNSQNKEETTRIETASFTKEMRFRNVLKNGVSLYINSGKNVFEKIAVALGEIWNSFNYNAHKITEDFMCNWDKDSVAFRGRDDFSIYSGGDIMTEDIVESQKKNNWIRGLSSPLTLGIMGVTFSWLLQPRNKRVEIF